MSDSKKKNFKQILLNIFVGFISSIIFLIMIHQFNFDKIIILNSIYSLETKNPDCSGIEYNSTLKKITMFNARIEKGFFSCLKDKEIHEIEIKSNLGGLSYESIATAIKIQKENITVTLTGPICASACVDLLASSYNSQMCSSSFIGIHQGSSYFKEKISNIINIEGGLDTINKIQEDIYSANGVNTQFYLDTIKKTPFESMHYLNSLDSFNYGFVKHIKDCNI